MTKNIYNRTYVTWPPVLVPGHCKASKATFLPVLFSVIATIVNIFVGPNHSYGKETVCPSFSLDDLDKYRTASQEIIDLANFSSGPPLKSSSSKHGTNKQILS